MSEEDSDADENTALMSNSGSAWNTEQDSVSLTKLCNIEWLF